MPSKRPLNKCPGYTCRLTNKCIAKRRKCDKIVDCLAGDDELNCHQTSFESLFKHAIDNMFFVTAPRRHLDDNQEKIKSSDALGKI